jgi:hypothetical protein
MLESPPDVGATEEARGTVCRGGGTGEAIEGLAGAIPRMAGGGETMEGLTGTAAGGSDGGATGDGSAGLIVSGVRPGFLALEKGDSAGRENGSRFRGTRPSRGLEVAAEGSIGARGTRGAEGGGPTGAGVAKIG